MKMTVFLLFRAALIQYAVHSFIPPAYFHDSFEAVERSAKSPTPLSEIQLGSGWTVNLSLLVQALLRFPHGTGINFTFDNTFILLYHVLPLLLLLQDYPES